MREHEFDPMQEFAMDELLIEQLGELPPNDEIVQTVTPWRKATKRVLLGLALNALTLNFWLLNYILPAVGMVLMLLGFRALRRENNGFRACWFLTIIRSAYFFASLILNATVWQSAVYAHSAMALVTVLNLVLLLIQLCCLRSGFRAVQEKAGVEVRTGSATAMLVWYVFLCILSYLQYSGMLIGLLFIVFYLCIIRCLFQLSRELDEAGYMVEPAPVRASDRTVAIIIAAVLGIGLTAAYLFTQRYPMQWTPREQTEQTSVETIRVQLLEKGFPESVLNDLTAEEIAACDGALRVTSDVYDHALNEGREVKTVVGNTIHYSRVYDVKELRITSVAVQLPVERETWRIFHHFEWVADPGMRGTEALQILPSDRLEGWSRISEVTGRVLCEMDGIDSVAPYYSLGSETYQSSSIFFGTSTETDTFAEFSFPPDAEHCRGYVSYDLVEMRDGYIVDSWVYYIYQDGICYPARTAKDYAMYTGVSDGTGFRMIHDALQFYPTDDELELIN